VGEGGDPSLVIDRRCEDEAFAELEQLAASGASFVAISEERGEVVFGSGGPARVVIDPIDGSLNARRTLPSHSLSIAVASGPAMTDVEFGYVYDFGAGEEFVAGKGEGAALDGRPIEVAADAEKLELLGVESAEPGRLRPVAEALDGQVYRLRVIGSIAITTAYVAAARLDGMLSLRPCRSVDAAAAQLIVREAGGAVAFGDLELSEAGLGLDARYPIAAAAGELGLRVIRNVA
jgi:myo-inositol-1(or 4)-monophosphatase